MPDGFLLRTPCEDCPCRNCDYEQGCDCNLGYNTDLYWAEDGGLIDASDDCGLEIIKHRGGEFVKPQPVEGRKTRTDDGRWVSPNDFCKGGEDGNQERSD